MPGTTVYKTVFLQIYALVETASIDRALSLLQTMAKVSLVTDSDADLVSLVFHTHDIILWMHVRQDP